MAEPTVLSQAGWGVCRAAAVRRILAFPLLPPGIGPRYRRVLFKVLTRLLLYAGRIINCHINPCR